MQSIKQVLRLYCWMYCFSQMEFYFTLDRNRMLKLSDKGKGNEELEGGYYETETWT